MVINRPQTHAGEVAEEVVVGVASARHCLPSGFRQSDAHIQCQTNISQGCIGRLCPALLRSSSSNFSLNS